MLTALDRCVMMALLKWFTKDKSPSLSVTYSGYNECTFDPRASRRFPLWSVYSPEEKPTRMSSSSSCPTKINGLESSTELSGLMSLGTCMILCSKKLEQPGRLSSILSIIT